MNSYSLALTSLVDELSGPRLPPRVVNSDKVIFCKFLCRSCYLFAGSALLDICSFFRPYWILMIWVLRNCDSDPDVAVFSAY